MGLFGTGVHWVIGSATLLDCSKVPVPVQEIVNCPLRKTGGLNAGTTTVVGVKGFRKSTKTKLNSASRSATTPSPPPLAST